MSLTDAVDCGEIARRIAAADAILVTASNGLSISEGLNIFADNASFEAEFGDFKRAFGIRSIIQGTMFSWPDEESRWAFLARLIKRYCCDYKKTAIMDDLLCIVGDRPYFVLTSNAECHFELAGFDAQHIFEVEGNFSQMQCARACHRDVYPTFDLAERLVQETRDCRVPTASVPHCPRCGGPMRLRLQQDRYFVADEAAQARLGEFLAKYRDGRLVVLELGIGPRNQLIKAPVMGLVAAAPHATYVTVNRGEPYIPAQIAEKSFGIDAPIDEALRGIREGLSR